MAHLIEGNVRRSKSRPKFRYRSITLAVRDWQAAGRLLDGPVRGRAALPPLIAPFLEVCELRPFGCKGRSRFAKDDVSALEPTVPWSTPYAHTT
jgi:hypothetical protein